MKMPRQQSSAMLLLLMLASYANVALSSQCTQFKDGQAYYEANIILQANAEVSCSETELQQIGTMIDQEFDKVTEMTPVLGPVELKTDVCPKGTDVTECCSFDSSTCGGDGWCNESETQCGTCSGSWINPATVTRVSGCCSWDLKTCNIEQGWCDLSPSNCAGCNGRFVTDSYNTQCTALWQSCQVDSDCCGNQEFGAVCHDHGGWKGCQLPQLPTTRRLEMEDERKTMTEDMGMQPVDRDHRKLYAWWYHAYHGGGVCQFCDPNDDHADHYRRKLTTTVEQDFDAVVDEIELDAEIHLNAELLNQFCIQSTSCLHGVTATFSVEITKVQSATQLTC